MDLGWLGSLNMDLDYFMTQINIRPAIKYKWLSIWFGSLWFWVKIPVNHSFPKICVILVLFTHQICVICILRTRSQGISQVRSVRSEQNSLCYIISTVGIVVYAAELSTIFCIETIRDISNNWIQRVTIITKYLHSNVQFMQDTAWEHSALSYPRTFSIVPKCAST